jgi:hypothetical protein
LHSTSILSRLANNIGFEPFKLPDAAIIGVIGAISRLNGRGQAVLTLQGQRQGRRRKYAAKTGQKSQ